MIRVGGPSFKFNEPTPIAEPEQRLGDGGEFIWINRMEAPK